MVQLLNKGKGYFRLEGKDDFQKSRTWVNKMDHSSTELQNYFEERENYRNKKEIFDDVSY